MRNEGRIDASKRGDVKSAIPHSSFLIRHSHGGQAMLEYVLSLAAMLVVVAVMGYVVTAAVKSADRTNALVRADCP